MTEENPIRILLADDQDLVRLGFRLILEGETDLSVVGEAANGQEAVQLTAEKSPNIILMDVRMPILDGISATSEIVAAHPNARIIMLTTFDLDRYAFSALRAGASGFLLKDSTPADLLAAIRAVASGDATKATRVTRSMLEMYAKRSSPGSVQQGRSDPTSVLTPREREVLLAIGEGLSNGEIGTRFFLTESTVKTHVGRVLAKLQLRDRVHAVIFTYENNLIER